MKILCGISLNRTSSKDSKKKKMGSYERIGDILVHRALKDAVEQVIAPGTGISNAKVWKTLSDILNEFAHENDALMKKRDAIQAQVDAWYLEHANKPYDAAEYAAFLGKIGYLAPEGAPFKVQVNNVDPEISSTPAPQLVVPVDNARYALNAANSRWGSLLDAFYGTNAGPEESAGLEKGKSYNPARGAKVFEQAHAYMDQFFPLADGAKFDDVTKFALGAGGKGLALTLKNGKTVSLAKGEQFVGYNKNGSELSEVFLKHNNLHFLLAINPSGAAGKGHAAGVNDIIIEAASTAIADCEDSVAAVDAEDKARVYKNWAGLMRGDLSESFQKGGKTLVRKLNPDKTFVCASTGAQKTVPGRVVLLVRNVGMHLLTDAVRFAKTGRDVPEGLVDAVITVLAALHDLKKPQGALRNSRAGSVYVVKPKQAGIEEVAFHERVFSRVEECLGIARNTVKLGLMDEERRTTVNLKECIRAIQNRCIFINTGFLDRTGSEIHTCFRAGPVQTKGAIKKAAWRVAYEAWNVDIGIETGLLGTAQIGKGMFAKPAAMQEMIETKAGELRAGATTAWVPSPTAATLHALHYHMVDVKDVQSKIGALGRRAKLTDILTPPFLQEQLTQTEIDHELRDSLQGILGYIARWIQLGVGCSSVPDLDGVELMEDRATLRISSQLLGSWLLHGLVSEEQVLATAKEMAVIVDNQNKGQAGYENMSPNFNDNGFKCAMHMIFNALECPDGLTEGSLTQFRRAEKARRAGAHGKL